MCPYVSNFISPRQNLCRIISSDYSYITSLRPDSTYLLGKLHVSSPHHHLILIIIIPKCPIACAYLTDTPTPSLCISPIASRSATHMVPPPLIAKSRSCPVRAPTRHP